MKLRGEYNLPKYMSIPQNKLTLGTAEYTNFLITAKITQFENGFDNAAITLPDTTLYPSVVTVGTAIKLEVKDASETSYPINPLFSGIVRFPTFDISASDIKLTLHCDGAGYGLSDAVCAQEYGTQSNNPTYNTLPLIIGDGLLDEGILHKWVNHILNDTAPSGFSYASAIGPISNTIPYICFPYKPVNKCLDDLCDLVTALNVGTAGPHWIVTTNNVLHVKLVDATQSDWTKYYGGDDNSAGQATLTYGVDYETLSPFEKMGKEANYVVYYGAWRRPSNGDSWTESVHTMWNQWYDTYPLAISSSQEKVKVGLYSIKITDDGGGTIGYAYTPYDGDADLDLTMANIPNILPRLNFYALRSSGLTAATVWMATDTSHVYDYDFFDQLTEANTWYHFSLPIGPNYNTMDETKGFVWRVLVNPADWEHINFLAFYVGMPHNEYLFIDGVHFSGLPVCRVAREKYVSEGGTLGDSTNPLKVKVITDDVGKDDSLKADDDSGLMAQMAYAELLRLQKPSLVGTITTRMIKDVLPGQWFNIQGSDMRATKIIHIINPAPVGYQSVISLTDDLTNSHARLRYEDQNKQWAAIRPEFQDRQASSIKAGQIDIRIPRLECYYPKT